jgi:hypothetical protein
MIKYNIRIRSLFSSRSNSILSMFLRPNNNRTIYIRMNCNFLVIYDWSEKMKECLNGFQVVSFYYTLWLYYTVEFPNASLKTRWHLDSVENAC